MPSSIKLTIKQLKNYIFQLNEEEKEDLAQFLDKLTLKNRWEKFLSSKKGIPLSIEEITGEVEIIRSENL